MNAFFAKNVLNVLACASFLASVNSGFIFHTTTQFTPNLIHPGFNATDRVKADSEISISYSLTWNTFLGGNSAEFTGIVIGGNNNVYVTGSSYSSWGSPIRPYSLYSDAFVAKLDSNDNLLWNTFLGGSDYDWDSAISLDNDGNGLWCINRQLLINRRNMACNYPRSGGDLVTLRHAQMGYFVKGSTTDQGLGGLRFD